MLYVNLDMYACMKKLFQKKILSVMRLNDNFWKRKGLGAEDVNVRGVQKNKIFEFE